MAAPGAAGQRGADAAGGGGAMDECGDESGRRTSDQCRHDPAPPPSPSGRTEPWGRRSHSWRPGHPTRHCRTVHDEPAADGRLAAQPGLPRVSDQPHDGHGTPWGGRRSSSSATRGGALRRLQGRTRRPATSILTPQSDEPQSA